MCNFTSCHVFSYSLKIGCLLFACFFLNEWLFSPSHPSKEVISHVKRESTHFALLYMTACGRCLNFKLASHSPNLLKGAHVGSFAGPLFFFSPKSAWQQR
jgi:hypothetical protein